MELAKQGVISGYMDAAGRPLGLFGPGNPVTRAELAKIALLGAGVYPEPGIAPRNRSAKGTWAEAYVAKAEMLHWSVYPAIAPVHVPATRGEAVQTLLEAFKVPMLSTDDAANLYSDMAPSHRFAAAIATATSLGLLTGDTAPDGTLFHTIRADDTLNRAEIATLLVRFQKAVQK
jgi:hypothetical protein